MGKLLFSSGFPRLSFVNMAKKTFLAGFVCFNFSLLKYTLAGSLSLLAALTLLVSGRFDGFWALGAAKGSTQAWKLALATVAYFV